MYSAAEEGYVNIIKMLIKVNAKIDSVCKVSIHIHNVHKTKTHTIHLHNTISKFSF